MSCKKPGFGRVFCWVRVGCVEQRLPGIGVSLRAGGARRDTLQVHPCKLGRGIHAADGPARPHPQALDASLRAVAGEPNHARLKPEPEVGWKGKSSQAWLGSTSGEHACACRCWIRLVASRAPQGNHGRRGAAVLAQRVRRRPLIPRGAQGTGAQHRLADGGAFPPRSRKEPAGHGPALPARVRTEIRSIADHADSISAASGSSMR